VTLPRFVDNPLPIRIPRLIDAADEQFQAALHAVEQLPKVELHLHLEGALRPATVSRLARRHDATSPFCRQDWDSTYWTFGDLAGFVAELNTVLRASLREAQDWHTAATDCFADLAAQNVVYAEVSVSARLRGRPQYIPLAESLAGVEQARRDIPTGLRVGLIVGLSRHAVVGLGVDGPRAAYELVEDVIRARDAGAGIVGVDLHGDELTMLDVSSVVPAFQLAAEAGLNVRIHAGEAAGPESVWAALRFLGAQRIGHGVLGHTDPVLVRYLAEHAIPLDMCVTSNVLTGAVGSMGAHPIRELMKRGVAVTVSSDDPLVFQTTLTTELALLHRWLGFSLAELGQLTATASASVFQPADVRAKLLGRIRAEWPALAPDADGQGQPGQEEGYAAQGSDGAQPGDAGE
jgi:adenosine deaminase